MSNQLPVLKQEFYAQLLPRFEQTVGKETFYKEVSFAIQAARKSQALQKCDQMSILESVMNLANMGLTLNPTMQHAALIPRAGTCTLMPMFQGLTHIACKGGAISKIIAHIVYEKDQFSYELARGEVNHQQNKLEGTGPIKGVYAQVTYKDGTKQLEVMNIEEVHKIRAKSVAYQSNKNSGPWVEWEDEMFRKTALKRLLKQVNKTGVPDVLQQAVALENIASGFDDKATTDQVDFINLCIEYGGVNDHMNKKEIRFLEQEVNSDDLTFERAKDIKALLQGYGLTINRQPGPKLKDINAAIDDKMEDPNA